uniref:LOC100127771 protein n=1 Tax=Xenopus tropicalis TaxID=8364 RepID=A9JSP8_XENTR|nr:LOC100127771 protein [Xenopus tropicalis]
MVDGPGCTLNGEKIRARVEKGQSVVELRGSAVSGTPPSSCYNALSSLTGCSYTGVQTLGKELFMYFGLKAIRVHFGMNGSIRLNQAVKKGQENSRPMPVAVLEVQLEKDLICFYESTVDVRNVSECQEKIRFLEELDVCSSKFSFSRAECEIKKQKARMLCDILLDQMILPGVGNIIKNEALFDSGLRSPSSPIHEEDEEVSAVSDGERPALLGSVSRDPSHTENVTATPEITSTHGGSRIQSPPEVHKEVSDALELKEEGTQEGTALGPDACSIGIDE